MSIKSQTKSIVVVKIIEVVIVASNVYTQMNLNCNFSGKKARKQRMINFRASL